MAISQPQLTQDGVAFTVCVDFVNRDCIISSEALSGLSQLNPGKPDLMRTFFAFEAKINGVARRLVAAGVPGTPLQLGKQNFALPQAYN